MKVESFLITGIGGQGVILTSKIVARAAFEDGHTLNTLETLGAMQRGGPVYVQLRVGPSEYGAAIAYGAADAVIALEGYEGLRIASKYLKPGGVVAQNARLVQVPGHFRTKRKPVTVEALPELYRRIDAVPIMVPAAELATRVGNSRLENMAMLGAVVRLGLLQVKPETARAVIERSVPRGTEEMNLAAFQAGYEWDRSPAATPEGSRVAAR
jgi:indolepyruvate ferredoxin oxidoreductase beta subunit